MLIDERPAYPRGYADAVDVAEFLRTLHSVVCVNTYRYRS